MKLIEKKCPSCGGSLSFNDTDKSCRCDYCKKSFVIEREKISDDNSDDDYSLNFAPSPFRSFFYIAFALILVLVLFVIGSVFLNIYG